MAAELRNAAQPHSNNNCANFNVIYYRKVATNSMQQFVVSQNNVFCTVNGSCTVTSNQSASLLVQLNVGTSGHCIGHWQYQ
jgi:hypothetical protein